MSHGNVNRTFFSRQRSPEKVPANRNYGAFDCITLYNLICRSQIDFATESVH